jgi:hypothetical protein
MYLLVNTNFIVPKIKEYLSLEKSIEELQYETLTRSSDWNDRVYVVKKNDHNNLYKSDGNNIYVLDLSTNQTKIIYTSNKHYYNYNQYWIKYSCLNKKNNVVSYNDKINEKKINDNKSNNMSLTFNEKKNKNIILEDSNISKIDSNISKIDSNISKIDSNISKIDSNTEVQSVNNMLCIEIDNKNEIKNKKEEILKMIEEVNDLYQKELSNIKRLELNLKTYENKIKKLEKVKKDNIINEIIRTQSEYRTWKKIKYGIKEDSEDLEESEILKPINELEETNTIVPILFLSKYNYIDKIQNNECIKILLDRINCLKLNDLYAGNKLPDDDIIMFCNKYIKLSKELHYKFDDHEWNYLENEMNLNSTNKLGSNIISSSKI